MHPAQRSSHPRLSEESLAPLDALEETLLGLAHWVGVDGRLGELREPLPPVLSSGAALTTVQRIICRLRAPQPVPVPVADWDVVSTALLALKAADASDDVKAVTEAMTEAHETTPAAMFMAVAALLASMQAQHAQNNASVGGVTSAPLLATAARMRAGL